MSLDSGAAPVGGGGEPGVWPKGCPPEDLLCAYAEHALPPAEAEALEAHLARCAACRGSAALAFSLTPARPSGTLWLLRPRGIALVAAALLLAIGLYAVLASRGTQVEVDGDAAARWVAELKAQEPELLGQLELLSDLELAALAPPVVRGAPAVVAPSGKVLETRPTYEWLAVPGATRYRVQVTDTLGAVVLELVVDETHAAHGAQSAALEVGGTYIVTVTPQGGARPTPGSLAFAVLGEGERSRWARAESIVRTPQAGDVGTLVLAHHALRQGLRGEALRLLRAIEPSSAQAGAAQRLLRLLGADPANSPER